MADDGSEEIVFPIAWQYPASMYLPQVFEILNRIVQRALLNIRCL